MALGDELLVGALSLNGNLQRRWNDVAVVVLDTATRRGLVDSAYNERRAQCEAAARHFGLPVRTFSRRAPSGTPSTGSGAKAARIRRVGDMSMRGMVRDLHDARLMRR